MCLASRPATFALSVFLLTLPGACASDASSGTDEAGDLVVGLGSKADEGGCDPMSDLCWPSVDAAAMRGYFTASDALLLGMGDATLDALALVDAIDALSHKLTGEERAELVDVRRYASSLAPDAVAEARLELVSLAHAVAGAHLVSGFTTAHAVPLGARAEALSSPYDDAGDFDEAEVDLQLTPDMRASLTELRRAGVIGATYAFILENYGVLDRTYSAFDEEFPFSEPREERVERIVSRYVWASGRAAVVTNAEALIPYAGIPISIAHGALMQMRFRARMVFEIASAYGIDIREGDNLLLASLALMGANGMSDVKRSMIAAMAFPVVIAGVEYLTGTATVGGTLRRLLREAIRRAMRSLARESGEALARASLEAGARGAGRQILGYATFGLALIADIALATLTTARVGEHTGYMLRPWGSSMLTEGATELRDRDRRECAASVLGGMAHADGSLAPSERALLAAHVDRRIFVDGLWPRMNDGADVTRQARLIAAASSGAPLHSCLGAAYVGEDPSMRVALVSWAWTLAAVDGSLSRAEQTFATALEDRLRGAGYFDGDEIDEETYEVIRTRVTSLLLTQEDGTRLAARNVLEELARDYPRADDAFAAAGL